MALQAKAINALSLNLYKQLAKDEGNIFFSPLSISAALSTVSCGPRGHTDQETGTVLRHESIGIPNSELQHSFEQLLTVFSKSSGEIILSFANVLLAQKKEKKSVLPELLKNVEKTYRALLMEVDFEVESKKTVKQINDWVKKNTNGKIKSVVDSLESITTKTLLNCVYFKGLWEDKFKTKNTRSKVFYNRGQRFPFTSIPMMSKCQCFYFIEKETYKVLELPYKGDRIVMLILLPKQFDGLQYLESILTVEFLKDTVDSLDHYEVEVTLPKLDIEYSVELSKILMKLGVANGFQPCSNFNGVNPNPDDSPKVLAKSRIIVDEKGTKDASVTCVGYEVGCLLKETKAIKKIFKADHPFLFIIYDKKEDMALFFGRVIEF